MPDTVATGLFFIISISTLITSKYSLPLRYSLQRDEVVPAGKAVFHESPVQAEHEVEEKRECCYKVDETDHAEPIAEIGF